jgi:hypothetical protein
VGLVILSIYYHIDWLLARIEADGVVGAPALGGGLGWVFFGSLLILVPSLNILFWKWPLQAPTRRVHRANTPPGGAFAVRLGLLLLGAFLIFAPPILVPYPRSAGQYVHAVLIDYLGTAVVIIALAGLAQAFQTRRNTPSKAEFRP